MANHMFGADTWSAFKDTDEEGAAIGQAIAETESEIFRDALDIPDDQDGNFDNSAEWMEDIDGETHPDDYYAQEHAGADHNADAEALRQENAQLRAHIQANQPQPERPDMFASPDEWEENLLAQMRGEGGIPLQNYGQELPGKPDMFAQPEQYEAWLMAEAQRRSGVEQYESARIEASMAAAHEAWGSDWKEAYDHITSLNPNVPAHRQIAQQIMSSPDPGRQVMMSYAQILETDRMNRLMGGQGIVPRRQINWAERAHGLAYEEPTTDEGRLERDIFNSAFNDW